MKQPMKLNTRIYSIIIFIILLAFVMYLTQTQYFQQFSHSQQNEDLTKNWKTEAASASSVSPQSGPSYCLAYDSNDEFSTKVNMQASRTLGYMKKEVSITDLSKKKLKPSGCAAVILTVRDLSSVGNLDDLASYADQGGHIFLTSMPEQNDAFYRLYRKLGILNAGNYKDEAGVHLRDEVLIGESGLHIDDRFIMNTVMQVELDSSVHVNAETSAGTPLMWSIPSGKGSIMVFNGTMLQEKINRGLIAGAISMMVPDFIYPVFNSKVVYIDDWPAPYGNSIDEAIYKTYKLNRHGFFNEIWWPDMLKIAKRYNVKYTAVLIESYQNRVTPPFDSPSDSDPNGLIGYGREIIKSGGEIGLHGYNHQSLTMDQGTSAAFDYQPWNSVDDMTHSIQEAVSYAKQGFPEYTMFSYVPPSNVLSPEGREALKAGWKNLSVIASLFPEDATGISYVQEYELAKDGIMEMPRVTSGYEATPFVHWAAASVLTANGIFSHFVHPDDVLDSERNKNMNWENMYKTYSEMISGLNERYPWLRAQTSMEAAVDMKNMLTSRISVQQDNSSIKGSVTPLEDESYFILRTRKKVGNLSGCSADKIGDGIFLITVREAEFTIHLSEA
ncbi:hypothetical protein SAMN04487895_101262 [Paenibacillus sophorae]|uniref:DUF2194 domain-containing protein n=1 Tax=Paenibacillus sophorae TaxID=1333845 RepID=A0A1H8FV64_9BACL|nr:DUF2194 domain-containing protein [Paenibacillus sophorae]QWU13994.1 DUF2194 domain-containing protein [Paenibacillus sophorae]SEN35606.1 hypothetical protein SAMN04487895_101262 [Paenibacillus sophorae]